jgi:hypothetical protein
MIRWFASLPVSSVAISALFPGLLLSACESAGWAELGHDELLYAILPIIAWAAARWWTDTQAS